MPRNSNGRQPDDKDDPKKVPDVPVPGFVLGTTVAELVISKEGIRSFVMFRKGAISYTSKHRAPHFYHVPPDDTWPVVWCISPVNQPAIASRMIYFSKLRDYIHKYLQLPPSYEAISALYILLSWVYEFAPSVPYLRVIGDWGTARLASCRSSALSASVLSSHPVPPRPHRSSVYSTNTAAPLSWMKQTSRSPLPGRIWSRY